MTASLKLLAGALFAAALTSACIDPSSEETAAAAVSDPASAGSGAHRPRRPPPQAIDACAKAALGDACAFDLDSHHITGTCSHGPSGDGPLACKPDHLPPPPQEAIDACANAAAGDACSFTCNGDSLDGTCITPPDGDALVCAP